MLTSLRRIVLEFSQEPELQLALEHMATQIKRAMNTDCCSVYLADHQQQHFLLMASDGLAPSSLGHTTIGFSEGLIGLVGQREEPINLANAQQHPHFKHAPEVQEEAFNAFLGTPIIHQRKVLGVITIQQTKARNFDENEEAFLVTLSAQLAMALANAEARGVIGQFRDNGKWLKQLHGVPGAPGIALGEIVVNQPLMDLASVSLYKVYASESQLQRFQQAVRTTRSDFANMSAQLSHLVADNSLDIFEVYQQLLSSANLGQEVEEKINAGWSTESALKLVIDHYVAQFEALDDNYIRERASDIRDLGNRILLNLQQDVRQNERLPDEFILVAKEITAANLAEYQHRGLKAIVSLSGSNNSHAAILAKALGIPAIMGIDPVPLRQLSQQIAIVDGYSGELFIAPDESLKNEYLHLINEETVVADRVKQVLDLPAVTLDGQSIEVLLNGGLASGVEQSVNAGASGIGLYRTEIPFMNRHCFPSEQEQTNWYKNVLASCPMQPVTMRTLDIGGDKALPYFPIIEDNPFLGWRGIRITLDHPEIFLLQVRAMIRANIDSKNLEIMLPMISGIVEVDDAVRLINQAYFEVSSEENCPVPRPKIGIMLEVPSVIFQLKELAEKVDFFSVGSNDLTQYLLAVDRNNARVASLYDAFHPAVIRALNVIAQESQKYRVTLSICGELAGEPAGVLLLLAMGYDKLSMNAHSIARIKWLIRHVSFQRAKVILAHVLTLPTPEMVHSYLNEQLTQLGLGDLIRAGR